MRYHDELDALSMMFKRARFRLLEGSLARCAAVPRQTASKPRQPTVALRLLERGESTLDEFLEAKVTEALRPLAPLFDSADIAFLRETAYENLEKSPVLSALVERISHLTKTPKASPLEDTLPRPKDDP